jgi:class 3 adenylate cyclase/tetratricopeptide (TPR) repeat protein
VASAPTVCPNCGRPSADDARFCAGCGTQLTAPAREERKIVTALFADVVGSTKLGESLDAEDFRNVIDGAVGCMISAVEEFGGSLSEFTGDGVLGLFGSPVAHEDDPQRAVLAGLRTVELVESFGQEAAGRWGIEGLAVRIGIETGSVVLARVGATGSEVHGATGDALNTAARLQAAARPGAVLVGGRTQQLAERSFEWGERVQLELKGKAAPVVAYEALAERLSGAQPERAVRARIVGRDTELAAVREAIASVRARSGRVMFVVGEAGIGKSRILHEAREQFDHPADAPGLWLQGRCMSYAETLPYWPFHGMLREWLTGRGSAHDLRTALETTLVELLGDEARERLPFIAAVAGLPHTADEREWLEELTPAVLQRRTLDSVRSLVERLAQTEPLAIAVDDLHWADSSSLALLEELLQTADREAVLFLLASRTERDQPAWLFKETAAREVPHRYSELAVETLGSKADADLLAELVGGGTLPEEVGRQVLDRGEGNPFYIQELVRSLVDAGALVREGSGWRFDPEPAVELPDTVEKVVLARIDRLPSERRRVLDAAAVLGRQFALPVLAGIVPQADVRGTLGELQRMALVQEGAAWPHEEYRFAHSLIQEAAYASLLRRDRRDLHRSSAEVIERVYGDYLDERYAILADHWAEAGDLGRALEYHGLAGDAARRLFALPEAVEHYGRALDAADRLGLGEDDETVYRLRLRRGTVELGNLRTAEQDLRAALAASRAAQDRETEMHALAQLAELRRMTDFREAADLLEEGLAVARELDDVAAQVRLLARRSIMDSNRLRLDAAFEHANSALDLARSTGDEGDLVLAMDALKLAALQVGDLETLERTTTDLAALARRRGDLVQLMWTLHEASFAAVAHGRWRIATDLSGEAFELSERIGNKIARALILDGVSWAQRCRGNYGHALKSAEEANAFGIEQGILEWEAWTAATLGWLLLEMRRPQAALAHLERGIVAAERSAAPAQLARCSSFLVRALAWTGDTAGAEKALTAAAGRLGRVHAGPGQAWLFGGHCYVALAYAQIDLGRAIDGRTLIEQMLPIAERSGWREMVAQFSVAVGDCALAAGDTQAARSAFERGLAVSEESGMPEPQALAHAGLANCGVDEEGHVAAARSLFLQLAETLEEPDLAEGLIEAAASGARSGRT